MIRAKIELKAIKWNEQKVAAALASDPTISAAILGKAHAVAGEARTRIAASPKAKVAKQRVGGFYFSERPDAIAKTVDVKTSAPLIITTTKRGSQMPVALVVADHPYSGYYAPAFASALVKNAGGQWRTQGVKP